MIEWRHDALCLQVDPELFFPDKGKPGTQATAVCRRCDVSQQCLDYALKNRITEGIWGGVHPRARRGRYAPLRDPSLCVNGHEKTAENTSTTGRCLICQRIQNRKKIRDRQRREYDRDTG